jgi:putative DNA primase/helicase
MTKVPYSAHTGRLASSTNPATWASFIEVVAYYRAHQSRFDGIGFVVTDADPYVGVDLDHVIDPDTGAMDAWAVNVLSRLHSYSEISPSGTGVRIFVKGSLPTGGRKSGPFEIYESGRYLTVTGNTLDCGGGAWCLDNEAGRHNLPYIAERTEILTLIHEEVFGKPEPAQSAPRPMRGNVTRDDQELIQRAMDATNGAKFRALWHGLPTHHPSTSEADEALISHLSFWTDGDPQRMDALFRQSARYRDKWDEVHDSQGRTYGAKTILAVLRTAATTNQPAEKQPRKRIGGGIPL